MHYSYNLYFSGIVATGEGYTMHNTHSTEHSVPLFQNIEQATQKVNTFPSRKFTCVSVRA